MSASIHTTYSVEHVAIPRFKADAFPPFFSYDGNRSIVIEPFVHSFQGVILTSIVYQIDVKVWIVLLFKVVNGAHNVYFFVVSWHYY